MYHIGIDLGGTNIAVGVTNDDLKIIGRGRRKTPQGADSDTILKEMAAASLAAVQDAGLTMSDISDAGIAAPGTINSETGIIKYSNNIKFENYPAVEKLKELLKIDKCFIANDANAAAYGELLAGAGKGCKNFVAVTLGTGVGSGIIINGKILTGSNFAGAEVGHTYLVAGGEKCSCGNCGCFEAYASATALKRQTARAMKEHPDSLMWKIAKSPEQVDGRTAFDAMRKNDKAGKEVVDNYIRYVAAGIVNIINIFQPEFVCIGGGICNEKETLLAPIREFINKHDYNRDPSVRAKLVTAVLGNDAGIIGAAGLYRLN